MKYSAQPKEMRRLDHRWQDQAECKGVQIDLFYPERGQPVVSLVKDLCANCEVRHDCLEYALHHERHGVWGGTTESQRDVIRRERNIIVKTPEMIYHSDTLDQRREAEERRPKLRPGPGKKN